MLLYQQKPPPRAEREAYQVLTRFGPLQDEPADAAFAAGVVWPDRAPAAPRTVAGTYQAIARFVDSDLLSFASLFITDAARSAARAPPEAYDIPTRATTLIDTGLPQALGYVDQQPRRQPRPQRAEQLQQRAQWLPEEPLAWGTIDSDPRLPPRAAREAYSTPLVRPWDEEPCDWGFITGRAAGAVRAVAAAYWVEHVAEIQGPDAPAFGSSLIVEPVFVARLADYGQIVPSVRDEPEIGRSFVEPSGVRRQASVSSAYWVDQPAGISDPDQPPQGLHEASDRHQASSAPIFVAIGVVIADPPCPGAIVVPARAPDARRSTPDAFDVPSRDLTLLELALPAQYGHIEASGIRRQASGAPIFVAIGVVIADPPCPGAIVVPARAPDAQHLSPNAFEAAVSFVVADPPVPGTILVPDRAPPAQRLSPNAFESAVRFEISELPAPGAIVVPARMPDARRLTPDACCASAIGPEGTVPGTIVVTQPTPPARLRSTNYGHIFPMQIDELLPVGHGEVASPLPIRRLPSAVYIVLPGAGSAEPDDPAARGFVESLGDRHWALGVQATTALAAITSDAPPPGIDLLANRFAVYRLPSAVYHVAGSFVVAEPAPPGSIVVPAQAPDASRLTPDAFDLTPAGSADQSAPPLPYGQVEPLRVYRLPSAVYHVAGSFVVAEPTPPGSIVIPAQAPDASRLTPDAFDLTPAGSADQSAPSLPYGQVVEPLPVYRLPSAVYQVMPPAMASELDPPSALGFIEPAVRRSPRSAAAAYNNPQRANEAGDSEPAAWGFLETYPRRSMRAVSSAYLVIASFGYSPPVRLSTTVAVFGAWGETHQVLGGDAGRVQVYGEDSEQETID